LFELLLEWCSQSFILQDLGYKGAEFATPNIDALALGGVRLENFYVQPMCSPTRASLLTGEYPMRFGLQHQVIFQAQPVGVPLDRVLLPQRMKQLGYKTRLVGKWHLGFYQWQYTPTFRGFDSHFGFLSADIGYFDYTMCRSNVCSPKDYLQDNCPPQFCGYDLWADKKPVLQKSKKKPYSTELFAAEAIKVIKKHDPNEPLFMYLSPSNTHTPLEWKQWYVDSFCSHITNDTRRGFCGQAVAFDLLVKNVTTALKLKGMWSDTIVFFTSDNGGEVFDPTAGESRFSYGTNWPYRGGKITVWEGGVRGNAFIYGDSVIPPAVRGSVNTGLFHAADYYNTIISAAGGSPQPGTGRDSIDAWSSILAGVPSPRQEVLINVDQMDGNSGALREGNWKLIVGNITAGQLVTRAGYPYVPNPTMISQGILSPCTQGITGDEENIRLYDLSTDPSECTNVAASNPGVTFTLLKRYIQLLAEAEFPNFPFFDPNSNPDYYGGRWSPWLKKDGTPISPKAKKTNVENTAQTIALLQAAAPQLLAGNT